MRDARYDILFDPIRIGPVTAKNRFYQVPHCTGMGWLRPHMLAAMRGVKAEGGWGVVCTEYCSVHDSSDDGSYPYARLWNTDDIRANALMTDAVHEHGALAGAELWIGGNYIANMASRQPTLGLRSRPPTNTDQLHPFQCRPLDKEDIRDVLKWQRDAALRAVEAGFDIVYVYATHGYLLSEFLDPETNTRTDEYGGSLENRLRIVRELIAETRDAVGDKAALAVRFTADLSDPESFDAFGLMAEDPDLWDLTVHDYGIEMGASRFVRESALEDSIARAKALTTKPVAAVGRFTSPDTMARVVRAGIQDMIGAARPSIADPFLPRKIEEGRVEDIRECIGCNVCYAHNTLGVPIRCTQNPTMGEEYRRGWHPERIAPAQQPEKVLIVGAGPAGLEAARVLGQRGHNIMLAEAGRELGGRVTLESRLPGLSEWARVRDWRLGQIDKLTNVEIFRESRLSVDDVLAVGADRVLTATGAERATDGISRHRNTPVSAAPGATVLTADTILRGEAIPDGPVLIYDDDHYYLGSVLALLLRSRGLDVTLVTPAGRPAGWGAYTNEQFQSAAALIDAGVEIVTNRTLERIEPDHCVTACIFSGQEGEIAADWVLPLTRREPCDNLYRALKKAIADGAEGAPKSVARIGDCDAPGIIATAVYCGYKAAVELGADP
ncbi:MAG: FAD-dependent oxidoreductase [Alphaproteobacteria bacterium]|nr:FAD-dependent oxidoreductase [Alphaproteobacteria bacterium]MBO6864190.1 FAD-dependent oxidoreductase [Alphaproteobacteria bacterium]